VASTLFSRINFILAENTRFRFSRNVAYARDVSSKQSGNPHKSTTMRKFYFYSFVIFFLISCTSDYQKGQKELSLEHYESALFLFQKVEKGNENYTSAQLKIIQIRKKLKNENITFKIDTIEKTSQDIREKKVEVLEPKSNSLKEKRYENLGEAKRKVTRLYISLMNFKDNSDFHENGFAVCCKYNYWMEEVSALRHSDYSDLLENQGYSLIDLQQIGLAYLRSNGKETDFTRYAKENSLWAIK